MQSLLIMQPIKPLSPDATFTRLMTPDPKEAVLMGDTSFFVDFGAVVTLDTVYLGYITALDGQQWAVQSADQNGTATNTLVPTRTLVAPGFGPPYHAFYRGPPIASRYWRVNTNAGPNAKNFTAGTIAFGLSWSSQWGHEMGAGRLLEDASTVERLFGGGFGIDEGAITGGYQWTFGDLDKDEIRSLYRLVKAVGISRPVLVVEDPEQTDGLNERIHWGLLSRLEAYERTDPANWRWALSVRDWA